MCQGKAGYVRLARGGISVLFGLVFWRLPEAKQHQTHIDSIGGDANNAEIMEHKEQDPGQVDRTSEGHQGTQHQEDGSPTSPQATCKTREDH